MKPSISSSGSGRLLASALLLAALVGATTPARAQSFTFTTLAGTAGQQGSTDGTRGAGGSRFNNPSGVAVDATGNVYVADRFNNTIRKISRDGAVTTLAGLAGAVGSANGTANAARFSAPGGVALDNAGNLYVTDSGNHTIRKITTDGTVTTVAGTAGSRGSLDATGGAARFNAPYGIDVDGAGNLYIADNGNHTIRKITSAGVVTTLAGTAGATGSVNGTGTAARFDSPTGIAVDGAGAIYVADYGNCTIRRISSTGVVTTLAGSPGTEGSADGTGSTARFNFPLGIALDSAGNIIVADNRNFTIRRLTTSGVVTTLAGTAGSSGSSSGTGSVARFVGPAAAAVDSANNIYIVDGHTIRWGATSVPTFTSATSGIYAVGASFTYTATWSGTLARPFTASGLAPGLGFNATTGEAIGTPIIAGRFAATLTAMNGAGTGTATLTLVSTAPAITLQPASQIVVTGTNVTFTAEAVAALSLTYQWRKNGTAIVGATNNSFTIPGATDSAEGSYTAVISTSAGSVTTAAAVLTVTAPAITTQPQSQIVANGANVTFTVVATGTPPLTYQWRKNGVAIAGATSSSFSLSAVTDSAEGSYTVVITIGATTLTSTAAVLAVSAAALTPAAITTGPVSQVANGGSNVVFSVVASGNPVPTFQWLKDGIAVTGATSATLSLSAVTASSQGSYTVRVSNTGGSVTSTAAVLAVIGVAPVITDQPVASVAAAGRSVTFRVVAIGASLTYQWQKDGTAIAGATSATFTLPSVQAEDAANYTVVVSSGSIRITSAAAALSVVPSDPGRLKNLSTLTPLAAGEKLTFGFVVGGAGTTGAKPLLVRAGGPSLSQLGVPNLFADPKLDFFSGTTQVGTSDNWGGDASVLAAQAATGAFPFASATSLDAAIFLSAAPAGNLSAIISGPATSEGNVIAEVYDATPNSSFTTTTPRLINVSVLKSVGTGFTIGFVLTGSTNTQVLIRAVGPTLTTLLNVGGTAPDPKMTLFNGASATIGSNDDWSTPVGTGAATSAQIAAATSKVTFALGAGSKDAAILATLAPGSYTVAVSVTGATGLGLVEVYEVR